jgi:hypothetical protein
MFSMARVGVTPASVGETGGILSASTAETKALPRHRMLFFLRTHASASFPPGLFVNAGTHHGAQPSKGFKPGLRDSLLGH